MKLKYLFRMSFDNALQQKGRIFFSVALYTIAMVLIGLIVLLGAIQSQVKNNLDKAVKNGLDNFGYLSYSLYNDETEDFAMYIGETMPKLDCIAGWETQWELCGWDVTGKKWTIQYNDEEYISDNLAVLTDVQGTNCYNNYVYEDGSLEMMGIGDYAWNMFNIRLYSGKEPEQCDYDEDWDLLYLGYEYRDIMKPGTIITDGKDTYVVAGILKKNTLMPVDDYVLTEDFSSETVDSVYMFDYGVLEVGKEDETAGRSSSCFFSVAEGYTFEEAESMISDAFSNIGGTVNVVSVSKWLNTFYDKENENLYREFLIMMVIVACLILACFQINSILSRRRDYGVFFASGLSHTDMIKMVVIENVIKIVIAVIIMFLCISVVINKEIEYDLTSLYMLKQSVFGKLGMITILVCSILILIESSIPAVIVKRLSPAELIGGK